MNKRVVSLLCACLWAFSLTVFGNTYPSAPPNNDNQRYLCLAIMNVTQEKGYGLDIIKRGLELGCNSVMLTIRWDVVHERLDSPANWEQFDEQIKLCKQLGTKMFLRIHLGRCCDRHIGFWTDEEASRDQKGFILKETPNMSHKPTLDKAMSFVREVCQRYQVYQQQGDILCVSATTTPTQEAGFHYEGNAAPVPPQYLPYLSSYDYSPASIKGFQDWLRQRYSNIGTINKEWRSDYTSIEDIYPVTTDYPHPENKRYTDWYVYRHGVLKNFLDQVSNTIKSVNSNYRVVNEFGSVWDDLSMRRATLACKDLARNVDGIKIGESLFFPLYYSSDILRSNMPANKWVMNELFIEPNLSKEQMTIMLNSLFDGGCKLVNLITSNMEHVNWFESTIKNAQVNWLNKPMEPIIPKQSMSVKLSDLVVKGSYYAAGYTDKWREKRKNGAVEIKVIEDLLGEPDMNQAPVVKKTIGSYTIREGFEAQYTIDPTSFEDPDGGVERYEFVNLPEGLSFDNNAIKGAAKAAGTYEVTVKAIDEFDAFATSKFKIEVLPQKPAKVEIFKAGTFQNRTLIRTLKLADSLHTNSINFDLNFIATPDASAKAVVFKLSGPINQETTETDAPFALFGDNGGRRLPVGSYQLVVESYNSTTTTTANGLSRAVYKFVVANNGINQPPTVVTPLANQNAIINRDFTFTVPPNTFRDVDGAISRVVISGLPSGLRANGPSISGKPTQIGSFLVKVEAFDNENGSVATQFTLRVSATNLPPVVNGQIPNQSVEVQQYYEYTLPTDLFIDPDGIVARISVIGLPGGMSFQNGKIAGRPTSPTSSRVTVRAFDNIGAWAELNFTFTVTASNINEAPILVNTIGDQRALTNTLFSFSVPVNTFKDPEGGTLTISFSNLPAGLNATNGTISGTPTTAGEFAVTVRATDNQGAFVETTFKLNIARPNDNLAPIVVNPIADQSASVGQPFRFEVPLNTFKDPDGFISAMTVRDLPPGLTYSGGVISGTPTKVGNYTVTVRVLDNQRASAEEYFIIKVTSSKPLSFVFSLFRAGNTSARRFIQTIKNGDKINADALPSLINIFVEVSESVDLLEFEISGARLSNTLDNAPPYGLAGDDGGFNPAIGKYLLKATAYRKDEVVGSAAVEFQMVRAGGGAAMNPLEMAEVLTPYPNPFKEVVHVVVPYDYQANATSFALINLAGQAMPLRLVQWEGPKATLDLTPLLLPKGMYLLQIQHTDFPNKTVKILKE